MRRWIESAYPMGPVGLIRFVMLSVYRGGFFFWVFSKGGSGREDWVIRITARVRGTRGMGSKGGSCGVEWSLLVLGCCVR